MILLKRITVLSICLCRSPALLHKPLQGSIVPMKKMDSTKKLVKPLSQFCSKELREEEGKGGRGERLDSRGSGWEGQ